MKTKKKLLLGTVAGIITLAIALCIYNYAFLKAYYQHTRYNHFNIGDNVYTNNFDDDGKPSDLNLYRLIKSKTTSQYDVTIANVKLSSDSLLKRRSVLVGIYLGHKYLPVTINQKKFVVSLYSIRPAGKVLAYYDYSKLPPGYKYVNNKLYVFWDQVSDKPAAIN